MPNLQDAPDERTGYALTLQKQNTRILQDGKYRKADNSFSRPNLPVVSQPARTLFLPYYSLLKPLGFFLALLLLRYILYNEFSGKV
jgi:hypothetical protein